MNSKQIAYPLRDRWSYLWLLIGTALTLFGTGQWTIQLLTWLGGHLCDPFYAHSAGLEGRDLW
jgi:uncharacterized membrane protein